MGNRWPFCGCRRLRATCSRQQHRRALLCRSASSCASTANGVQLRSKRRSPTRPGPVTLPSEVSVGQLRAEAGLSPHKAWAGAGPYVGRCQTRPGASGLIPSPFPPHLPPSLPSSSLPIPLPPSLRVSLSLFPSLGPSLPPEPEKGRGRGQHWHFKKSVPQCRPSIPGPSPRPL